MWLIINIQINSRRQGVVQKNHGIEEHRWGGGGASNGAFPMVALALLIVSCRLQVQTLKLNEHVRYFFVFLNKKKTYAHYPATP